RDLLSGDQFAQLQFDLRMQAAITLDRFRQIGKHDGAAEAYGQNAFLPAAQAARHFDVVLHPVESIRRTLPEILTNPRKADAAGRAIEKRISKNSFEAADLLAEWRLRHSQLG